jgi:hypothetical protein
VIPTRPNPESIVFRHLAFGGDVASLGEQDGKTLEPKYSSEDIGFVASASSVDVENETCTFGSKKRVSEL